jgi:hypothetical protein
MGKSETGEGQKSFHSAGGSKRQLISATEHLRDLKRTQILIRKHLLNKEIRVSVTELQPAAEVAVRQRCSAALLPTCSNRRISTTMRCYFRSAAVKVMALVTLSAAGTSVSTRLAAAVLGHAAGGEAL